MLSARWDSWLVVGLAALALLLGLGPARAQDEEDEDQRLRVEARLGFIDPDELRPGWTPLEVLIHNPGPARRVEARVRLQRVQQLFSDTRRRLELAAGSSRREWFLFPFNSSWGELNVTLHALPEDDPEQPILVQIEPEHYSVTDTFRYRRQVPRLLFVSERESSWRDANLLFDPQRFSELKTRAPQELPPHPFAYDDIDLVAVHDADLSGLDPAQRGSLLQWVQGGGGLVLVPGRRRSWLDDPAIRAFLGDAEVRVETVPARFPRLEAHYGTLPRHDLSVPVFRLETSAGSRRRAPWKGRELGDGRFLLDEGTELVQSLPCGRGWVHLVAADLSGPPFASWLGYTQRRDLLQAVKSGAPRLWRGGLNHRDPYNRPALCRALDSDEQLPLGLVVGLVLAYLLCVCPLNYLLVRRLDRPLLFVLTVPLISLLFCGLVFGSGYLSKGLGTVVWRTSLISTGFGHPWALEQSQLSIRSSVAASYAVGFPAPLVANRVHRRSSDTDLLRHEMRSEGGRLEFPRVDLSMWEQAVFAAYGFHTLSGSIRLEEQAKGVRLINDSPYAIERGLLIMVRRGAQHRVGALGPGASLDLLSDTQEGSQLQPLGAAREALADSPEEAALMHALLSHGAHDALRQGPLLVARIAAPSHITVDGSAEASRELHLLVVEAEPR